MMAYFYTFIHNVFIGFIALFPVINPIGTAFVVNPFLENLSHEERKSVVKKITLYTFYLCVVALVSGRWILELFGLSIPIVRLAGGIVITKIGWDVLYDNNTMADKQVNTNTKSSLANKLFYPITFPITAGGGAIAVLFALSAHSTDANIIQNGINLLAIVISIVAICILVYIFYLNSNKVIQRIGNKNQSVVSRIMAFLIMCVGLQIAITGIEQLVKRF
ncbi:MAG: MarC family protein [Chitinophagaceae bacterium]